VLGSYVVGKDSMDIGERLRALRKAAGLSHKDSERRCGLLGCYTSRVEHGHTVPTLATLEKYAKVLGIEVWQLLSEENQPIALKVSPKVSNQDPLAGLSKRGRELILGLVRRMRTAGEKEKQPD
jgi:transcriptional regulator with XRE-family HTH domain